MTTTQPNPWLRRVHALLAKAESTEFPEEAEALLAKAQELMTRHSIDEALLADARPPADDVVTTEDVCIPAPYARAKTMLLWAIAHANGCRGIQRKAGDGSMECQLFGFRGGITATITLFGALSMHGTRLMLATPVPPWDTPRSFRHAFLIAYAARIGRRLRDAAEHVRRTVECEEPSAPGRSVSLVLADRKHRVDQALEAAYPFTSRARPSQFSSGAGASAGIAAADTADLGGARLTGSGPRGLVSG